MGNSFWRMFFGLLLITAGAIILLDHNDIISFDLGDFISNFWPVILIIVGVWMIYEHAKPSKSDDQTVGGGCCTKNFGNQNISPEKIEQSGLDYSLMMGDLNIDLSKTLLIAGENNIRADLSAGDLRIMVPANIPCSVSAACSAGDINIFGKTKNGISVELNYRDDNYDSQITKIKIRAKCSLGDIKIMRQV